MTSDFKSVTSITYVSKVSSLYCMCPFGSLWGHHSLQTAPEVKSGLRFEISDPNYLLIHVHIAFMVWALLAASEATTASKQPQSSNLASDLKSVTPFTYLSMCILIIWYGLFWQPPRPPQPQNSLRGQTWPQFEFRDPNYLLFYEHIVDLRSNRRR